jgi:hypothetical protein
LARNAKNTKQNELGKPAASVPAQRPTTNTTKPSVRSTTKPMATRSRRSLNTKGAHLCYFSSSSHESADGASTLILCTAVLRRHDQLCTVTCCVAHHQSPRGAFRLRVHRKLQRGSINSNMSAKGYAAAPCCFVFALFPALPHRGGFVLAVLVAGLLCWLCGLSASVVVVGMFC